MKPGDIVKFRREIVEYDGVDDTQLTNAVGIIISDETAMFDLLPDRQLFDVMIDGRIVAAYNYELELIDETR
jgi:hypothetical protein